MSNTHTHTHTREAHLAQQTRETTQDRNESTNWCLKNTFAFERRTIKEKGAIERSPKTGESERSLVRVTDSESVNVLINNYICLNPREPVCKCLTIHTTR